MESLVVFFCNNNTVSPILRVYHDKENIISSIIEKACSLEVLDLSEYYPSDDTDFSE